MKVLLAVLIFCTLNYSSSGQAGGISVKEWVEKLSDPGDKTNQASRLLTSLFVTWDTLVSNQLFRQIQAEGNTDNKYFKARFNALKAMHSQHNGSLGSVPLNKVICKQLLDDAMHAANETNDECLIAYISQVYYGVIIFFGDTELAVMYGVYSTELYEKNFGVSEYPPYNYLGELMYRVREYEKSIEYCLKWLSLGPAIGGVNHDVIKMMTFNTAALAYHRTRRYDSAMYYYNKALDMAEQIKRLDWKGIVSGNMGQVYYILHQYDTARALLEMDYRTSMGYRYFDNAAHSLQWAARANAAMGNKTKALQQVRESMQLIKTMPDSSYQQNIYFAAIEVYKLNGLYDSALYYSGLHQNMHDAIEKKLNFSSVAISKVRMNVEKSLHDIRRLQLEKKSQLQQRNFIIIGILLLSVISILVVNGKRIKLKYLQQSLEQENKMMETEVSSAKQQMEMFTQNIIEKTSLLEKLEQQMQMNSSSAGQQETISALSNLAILTENDWTKFKSLFEKIHPLFFQRLKTKAPDITVAEQRMAALTRLQLTTRQMASMQGISPDSVHKTRQRLRQRLAIHNETNMEEYLAGI